MKTVSTRPNPALLLSLVFTLASLALPASAKKMTITDRQTKLSGQIEAAFKSNQLTLKEAEGLRHDASKVSEKEIKMKEKNAGRLSYSDETDLERDLNKLSLKIHKKVLDKRVQ